MANLITSHDPYHVHKILGTLVLLHYLYRFYLIYLHGEAFPESSFSNGPSPVDIAGVVLHGLLSWSSLLLPLPVKRNYSKPMIWPEFRLHSITFATRHVAATLFNLTGWGNENFILDLVIRSAIVLGAVVAASAVTDRYGCREKRTTNAMPYPPSVDDTQQRTVKKGYMLAQFGSTAACLFSDSTVSFASLLGIQMAPLLMTLVRKGKVSSYTYHRVYALSLYLGYAMIFARMVTGPKSLGLHLFFAMNIPHSKIRPYMMPLYLWSFTIIATCVIYPKYFGESLESWVSDDIAKKMMCFATAFATLTQVKRYAPLFGVSRIGFKASMQQKKSV